MLNQKIKQIHFAALLWKNANLANPVILNPIQNGWLVDKHMYKINWDSGEQLPQTISTNVDSINWDDSDSDFNSSDDSE